MEDRKKVLLVDDVLKPCSHHVLKDLEATYDLLTVPTMQAGAEAIREHREELSAILLCMEQYKIESGEIIETLNSMKITDLPIIAIVMNSGKNHNIGWSAIGLWNFIPASDCARTVQALLSSNIDYYTWRFSDCYHPLDLTDHLTGLFNRIGFFTRAREVLNAAIDTEQWSVLFFNIRGFKAINDFFGSDGGDRVLKNVGGMLDRSFLKPAVLARMEMDHFAMLVNSEALDLPKLTTLCAGHYENEERALNFFCNCGIFEVKDRTENVTSMYDKARLAKNYIYNDYSKPYATYCDTMRRELMQKENLTSELENAILSEQIRLYYQPIIDTHTGSVESAEVLVRWKHPKDGLLGPDQFIPFFEENGHISKLDSYITKKVVSFLDKRLRAGKRTVPVSVNLSRRDFTHQDIRAIIERNITSLPFPAQFIRVELTETAFTHTDREMAGLVDYLRSFGIQILVDDFGIGYSTFALVQDFNFDFLKLGIDFIQFINVKPKTNHIIRTLIGMAHELGVKVVAEGVETKEQVDFLRQENCDLIQGYYYYKPMPEEDFTALLDTVP